MKVKVNIADKNGQAVVYTSQDVDNLFAQKIPNVPVSSVFGRTGTVTAQSGDYTAAQVGAAPSSQGVTNGNSHAHSTGDGAQINHTSLSNIGTNTHVQIDTHIASTSNPHNTTASQVGLGSFEASSSNIKMDGTASVGLLSTVPRADHIHPTDTSRVSTTTTVNGHALSSNVTLSNSDVGAPKGTMTITVSNSVPSSPSANDFWIDTN